MALHLRENEELKIKVDFHWLYFLNAALWAGVGLLFILSTASNKEFELTATHMFIYSIIFFGPLTYKVLANLCKDYSVTSQRLYVEEGILSKKKRDIPLNKINDLEVSQGIIQRIFGAGNILVHTGNDKPTKIQGINEPEEFKSHLSKIVEEVSRKAAS